jgi:hypothetical protein
MQIKIFSWLSQLTGAMKFQHFLKKRIVDKFLGGHIYALSEIHKRQTTYF